MDSPTYITNAIRTESVPESIEMNQMTLAVSIKLAILSSKMMDMVKRKIFYGKDIDPTTFKLVCQHMSEGAHIQAEAVDVDINHRATQQVLIDNDCAEFQLDNINIRLLHSALGCFTESGELLEALDKQYLTGQLDLVNFGEEIGDIEWYQAIGFDETKVTEASCREKNIAKLRKRYPEKFDADQAVNRDLDAERKTLE